MKVEVSREINVSPEDFYDYMVNSVCEQINVELQASLKPEDIRSGYTHKTKQTNNKGKTEKIRYTIKEAKRPSVFTTVYTSAARKTTLRYTFEPGSHGGTVVTYSQETIFADPSADTSNAMTIRHGKSKIARQIAAAEKECRALLRQKGRQTAVQTSDEEPDVVEEPLQETQVQPERKSSGFFGLFKKK